MIPTTILRGQLYYANLEPSFGSEQGGIRLVLIIQNDVGNMYSPTVIIAALTGRLSTKHSLAYSFNCITLSWFKNRFYRSVRTVKND